MVVIDARQAGADAAAQLLSARRARDRLFGDDAAGFGEPGWDMLLALFANRDHGLETAAAIAASAAAPSTAALYIDWLLSRGLVLRDEPQHLAISPRGAALMAAYLDAGLASGIGG